jgi:hypothetical protein
MSWIHVLQLLLAWSATNAFLISIKRSSYYPSRFMCLMSSEQPQGPKAQLLRSLLQPCLKAALLLPTLSALGSYSEPARALGSLHEFKDLPCVLHSIDFNVENIDNEIKMFDGLFQQECKELRRFVTKEQATSYLAFGPDSISQPKNFYPGISSLLEYGGHSSLKLTSKNLDSEGIVEIFRRGNGLQFIKIGTDVLRLSKGIDNGTSSFDLNKRLPAVLTLSCILFFLPGAKVKYGYGWIELDTPNGIPLQVVVGQARDPIMACCLRVTDLVQSVAFCIEQLGMSIQPYPLARAAGSQFEPGMPENSAYVSYGGDSLGLVLREFVQPKGRRGRVINKEVIPPLDIGSQLQGFTVLVDDHLKAEQLPLAARAVIERKEAVRVTSPDGYSFTLSPATQFEKLVKSSSR